MNKPGATDETAAAARPADEAAAGARVGPAARAASGPDGDARRLVSWPRRGCVPARGSGLVHGVTPIRRVSPVR